jgi:hypothetical protein
MNQLSLEFDPMRRAGIGDVRRGSARRSSPDDAAKGLRRKRRGQKVVAGNNREWTERMREIAQRICEGRTNYSRLEPWGTVTTDDLRLHAQRHMLPGLKPNSNKAWGGIFCGPHWLCVGQVRSTYKTNNGRFIRQWRWVA